MSILQEFHPPSGLPNGNVGTPLRTIYEQIQQCILPPIALKKLGIELYKLRPYRRYGEVFLDYNQEVYHEELLEEENYNEEDDEIRTNVNNNIEHELCVNNNQTMQHLDDKEDIEAKYQNPSEEESASDSEHGAEEWERHEAFQDSDGECKNPQDRQRDSRACTSKNYLYEEELEVTWDKGGSGLVFYTDNAFWDQQRGDMDDRDADSFDVDTSKYYQKEEELFTDSEGAVETHSMKRKRKRGMTQEDAPWNNLPVGHFEKYNNGIAGRIMKSQGWSKGQGIGPNQDGIALPISMPFQRGTRGIGYVKQKQAPERTSPERNTRWISIQSIYDMQREQERKDREKDRTNSFPIPIATQEAVQFVSAGFLSNDLCE